MFLYHGSNVPVSRPVLMPLVRALDFGAGFYLTTDFDQAARWARTSVLRRGSGVASVSSFELADEAIAMLKVLRFSGPDADWLRFVSRNRNERIDDSGYDIVAGPVANDNTMPVLNLYFSGVYTEEEALRRLLPQRLRDQYAMKTAAALSFLRFKEVRNP
ncbi:MAG: DUF3990 domain-containing protein [Kiritimatiellae bacterium]|nr:DUF3990 domain-containing protein [Kiritimatiellia bacterium]